MAHDIEVGDRVTQDGLRYYEVTETDIPATRRHDGVRLKCVSHDRRTLEMTQTYRQMNVYWRTA